VRQADREADVIVGERQQMRRQTEIRAVDISPQTEAGFWALVHISYKPPFCWLWQGMVEGEYGRFKLPDGRKVQAHRLAYALSNGCTPADKVIRHKCDNGLCVSPYHTEAGTDAENMADRDARGRTPKGECVGTALLTEAQAAAIKADPRFAREIAAEYGISKSTVNKIRLGINWGHLTHVERVPTKQLRCARNGSRSPGAILTEDQVRAIKQDPRFSRLIAADYGVSKGAIDGIKRGTSWRHV